MKKNDYTIRPETPADYRETENTVREAFWNVYRPGCLEHYVLNCLRKHPDFVKDLNFVMEKDGRIIGQACCVRAEITADDGSRIPGSGSYAVYCGFNQPDKRSEELGGRKCIELHV